MNHFMDNNVLDAGNRFFHEFQIEPNPAGSDGAGSPLCFHALYAPFGNCHAKCLLPFGDKRREQFLQLLPLPLSENPFPSCRISAFSNIEVNDLLIADNDPAGAIVRDDVKQVPPAKEKVAFA